MTRILSLFVVFMLTGVLAFSQSRVVNGQILDEKGNSIPNVSIKLNENSSGSSATGDGVFSIKAKSGDALTFSSVGYAQQTVKVGSNSNLNIVLLQNSKTTNIEAVTVISTGGLGGRRNAAAFGGTAVTTKGKDITIAKPVNLQNGLTGKVSGLSVTTTNSGVFADTRITIRGTRSLTGNNQPMLILDGVPVNLGFLSSINPNDIAEVTTLKSSSSTAIYGPDGVNGALVVTTKKGSKGSTNITLSHTIQFEKVAFLPKFQTQFGAGSAVDAFGNGVYDGIENQGYGDQLDGSVRQLGRDGPGGIQLLHTYVARPNEKKDFFNTGITNQTDLSFSAKDFYLSVQNVDIQGILPKDENKRISLRMTASKELSNKLSASFNINYVQQKYNVNAGSQFGNGRDFIPYWNVINTPIDIPLNQFKDWKNDYFSSPDGFYNDYYRNPYFTIDNFREVGRSNDVLGNIEFNYKLSPIINLTYRLGGTFTNSSSKSTSKAFTYSSFAKASGKNIAGSGDIAAGVLDNSSYSTRLNSEIFATLQKSYKKLKFDVLVGQSYRESISQGINISNRNLGIPQVLNIASRKGEPGATQSDTKTRLQRFFGRAGVGFNDWAFAEFTGSYDMDSRLSNPNDYQVKNIGFFYPGANVSLVLSQAIPSLRDNRTISFLKIHGAVSKTGNVNLGAYNLENTFTPGTDFPYGTLIGFSANNTLRRPTYRPEFVSNTEVGIEIGLLKNRISFEANAYTQNNTDQVITVNYSASTGYPQALLNAASFINRGLEFDLKLTPLVKIGKANIDFKINYTRQENEVTKLIDGVKELGIGNSNFIVEGSPAYVFKLTDYDRDNQGRVIIGTDGLPTTNTTLQQFGRTTPTDLLGMTLSASLGNLSLSITADYRGGHQILSDIGSDLDFTGLSYRSGQNGRQRFIYPNSVVADGSGKYVPNTNVYTTGGYDFYSKGINNNVDANYLSSAAFWKLREVALVYTFPKSTFSDSKVIKGATVSFSGRNLFMWLPSTNEWTDPEFSNTTNNAQGVNTIGNNPPSRIFGANITLNF
jgi:TonB-linked SusC/RagA family outer membrane protein